MPYKKLSELPEAVQALPKHAQEIWMSAYNAAYEQYDGDEEKAFAVAWAAVKKKYKKEGDKWVKKEGEHEEWVEVFSVGTWTDSSGRTREWTEKDLEEIANNYNPEIHEAPVVIGHPEDDAPAYGWVESLKVQGGKLLAKFKDVAEEFKDWVRRGLYKKVSVALYPDFGLRHVGFLGAVPPAVKGLRPAKFSDRKPAWEIEVDFKYMDAFQQERIKSILRRLRDWIIDKFGMDEADRIVSSFEIDALTPGNDVQGQQVYSDEGGKRMDISKFFSDLKALVTGAEKELVVSDPERKFTEAEVQARINEEKEKAYAIAEKERKEKLEYQEKLRAIEAEKRRSEIHAFCESLAKEGKLIPAWQKMGIEEFIFSLDEGETLMFAEGQEKSRSQWFKEFLSELPKVVEFKKIVTQEGPDVGGSAGEKIAQLIKQKISANRDLNYRQAFAEVQKEHPELAREYQAEIRGEK